MFCVWVYSCSLPSAVVAETRSRDSFLDPLHVVGKLLHAKRIPSEQALAGPAAVELPPLTSCVYPPWLHAWRGTDVPGGHACGDPLDRMARAFLGPSAPLPLTFTPEKILEGCGFDGATVTAFVQHNCPAFFTEVKAL